MAKWWSCIVNEKDLPKKNGIKIQYHCPAVFIFILYIIMLTSLNMVHYSLISFVKMLILKHNSKTYKLLDNVVFFNKYEKITIYYNPLPTEMSNLHLEKNCIFFLNAIRPPPI